MSWPCPTPVHEDRPGEKFHSKFHSGCYDAWAMHDRQPEQVGEVLVQSWDAVDSAIMALRKALYRIIR